MFLTAVYPISERSALNLSGKVNAGNFTFFDNHEKYTETVKDLGPEYQVTSSEESKTPSTSMKVIGEDGEEIENLPFIISYDVYQSFWKLQSQFAADLKSFDPVAPWNEFMENARKVFDILKNALKNEKKTNNNNNINNDNKEKTVSNNDEELDRDNYFGCKYLTSSQVSSYYVYYSRVCCNFFLFHNDINQLFSLQLRDPLLRKQIAVQFLYFAHYME
jgi:hypothetical protein